MKDTFLGPEQEDKSSRTLAETQNERRATPRNNGTIGTAWSEECPLSEPNGFG